MRTMLQRDWQSHHETKEVTMYIHRYMKKLLTSLENKNGSAFSKENRDDENDELSHQISHVRDRGYIRLN